MSQSKFKYAPLVDAGGIFTFSAALGDGVVKYTDADRGKPVKLPATNTNAMINCVAGNEIEGFIETIEPFTVNQGFNFGTVREHGRVYAKIGANQGATAAKVGDYVVADDQLAQGSGDNYARVKTGTPTVYRWRIVSIESGSGAAGSIVLLKRI